MRYLCVIPARCGSKGIPLKNITDLCGRPMIAYTIDIVKELLGKGYVNDAIVSTDCAEIAVISERLGVEVPFLRPKQIAGDNAKSVDVALHCVEYCEKLGRKFDAVIMLQPTSPLRSSIDVQNAIHIFNIDDCDSLISAYREDTINDLIMYHKVDNQAIPLNSNHNKGIRRQDHSPVYIRNGAIYITKIEYLKREKRIISDSPKICEMNKRKSCNVDNMEDLEYIRYLLCK